MDYGTEEQEFLSSQPGAVKTSARGKREEKKKAGGGVKETDEETGMKLCPTSLLMTTSRVTARQEQSTSPPFQ